MKRNTNTIDDLLKAHQIESVEEIEVTNEKAETSDNGLFKGTEEELLVECMKRYPIGTKFHSAHISIREDSLNQVSSTHFEILSGGYVRAEVKAQQRWIPNVYAPKRGWAKIVK